MNLWSFSFFEWSNLSIIIHNHQCIYSVIKKHISFMQKKEAQKNSNKASRSREGIHTLQSLSLSLFLSFNHQRHFKSSRLTGSGFTQIYGSVFNLKAFSHYAMKAHTRKTSSSTFIHEMEFSALWLMLNVMREREGGCTTKRHS